MATLKHFRIGLPYGMDAEVARQITVLQQDPSILIEVCAPRSAPGIDLGGVGIAEPIPMKRELKQHEVC